MPSMTAAREIEQAVNQIAGSWITAEADQARSLGKRYAADIEHFQDWVACYGLELPVSGQIVAGYLLELGADGAALSGLTRAASAIAFWYDAILHTYLDLRPARAVLALIEAQTRPDRPLN